MEYILTTPATLKPLTPAQLKAHLRVTHDLDDDYIDLLQDAAIEAVQDYTHRQLLPATWLLLLDSFSSLKIEIEKLPVASITSIKYYDTENAQQTLSADVYRSEVRTWPAVIELKPDQEWPDTYDRINAIEITFSAGYAAAANVPEAIKHAIKLLVGNLYTYRDDLQQKPGLTKTSQLLLAKYVKPTI